MSFSLFNIKYKGKYDKIVSKTLNEIFEYNIDTNNGNIFLFKSEFPALLSIVKRFALYFIAFFLIIFPYFFLIGGHFFVFLFNFFIISVIFLIFLLLLLYVLNSFFTLRK